MDEWRRGWPTLLGCAIGGGTGAGLLFLTFSVFNTHLIEAFESTPTELAQAQTLIILAALGSPIAGWATDRFGFRAVFLPAIMGVILIELCISFFVHSMSGLALCLMLLGLFGIATTAVTTTRPVSAWFEANRGLALGLAASGTAVMTIVMPPIIEAVISHYDWRMGFATLALAAGLLGFPAVYFLVRNEPNRKIVVATSYGRRNLAFLRQLPFWILTLSITSVNLAQAGFVGQMSPMLQGEGLTPAAASIGISAFAVGTLVGRLIGGWALDRFNPRKVAIILGMLPASGFLILWSTDASFAVAIGAALLIGFQQGAEIDIFAFFTARIFGINQYGTVYGSLLGISWLGNAGGLIGVGIVRDYSGDYALAQLLGAAALITSALLIGCLPKRTYRLTGL
jgi:MFS family permease